jgi:hypothetical protein
MPGVYFLADSSTSKGFMAIFGYTEYSSNREIELCVMLL